jgi:hypothetical protein
MLLGEALDDLSKGKYKESLVEQLYRLDDLQMTIQKNILYQRSKF